MSGVIVTPCYFWPVVILSCQCWISFLVVRYNTRTISTPNQLCYILDRNGPSSALSQNIGLRPLPYSDQPDIWGQSPRDPSSHACPYHRSLKAREHCCYVCGPVAPCAKTIMSVILLVTCSFTTQLWSSFNALGDICRQRRHWLFRCSGTQLEGLGCGCYRPGSCVYDGVVLLIFVSGW